MHPHRIQIMETIIRIIDHISDKDYQTRIWIRGEGPEMDDFDETVCVFFGESDPVLENYQNYGLTKIQYEILKRFRDEFRKFCSGPALIYYLPEKFINTPEWDQIVDGAKDLLANLKG